MPEYPYETRCDNCGQKIFIHWSKNKGKEYPGNTLKGWKNFHQCPNWRPEEKPVSQSQPTRQAPAPRPQPTPEVDLQPADQMVQIKEKITSIILSRTVSYKYGKAKEYATEKEEIMDSLTCGLTVDIDSKDLNAIERTIDNNLQLVNATLRKELWHKYKLKLLTGEMYDK